MSSRVSASSSSMSKTYPESHVANISPVCHDGAMWVGEYERRGREKESHHHQCSSRHKGHFKQKRPTEDTTARNQTFPLHFEDFIIWNRTNQKVGCLPVERRPGLDHHDQQPFTGNRRMRWVCLDAGVGTSTMYNQGRTFYSMLPST